jgi:hypothetical protein
MIGGGQKRNIPALYHLWTNSQRFDTSVGIWDNVGSSFQSKGITLPHHRPKKGANVDGLGAHSGGPQVVQHWLNSPSELDQAPVPHGRLADYCLRIHLSLRLRILYGYLIRMKR